ncbi:MAG: glycosyltransferase [Parcubacteria group bacterium GW2011_GWE2_39_37]|uniref:Glycosyltransferase n=1 Tax=Candidatus Falkowbacteria bacterium GW2011_GWF2_39_8 TaxID=1618642 RepID=A0A0G0SDA0_9BACT|nr:MAG: glycosyltransferase [Parcubacteria group bacterium GW2011_GWE2_39_37]KKR32675.1 MAG: glycosyltransferase [Candidatus Falkowbacteria bacterium GW2011_GWF2_39_8]
MDISIIIVNYNSKIKTFHCLDSIYKADLNGIEYEIIVVDNDSREKINQEIKTRYSEVIFIQNNKNSGMGAGNNLGIVQATGKNILVLNPDTEVTAPAIRTMLDYLHANLDVGLVGPKLLRSDRTVQESCYRFPKIFIPIIRRTFLAKFAKNYVDDYLLKNIDLTKSQTVDWIQGSCLLIKKEVIDKVGMFDERFFMYLEDTDLCKRISLAGWKVVYLPTAEVFHLHERASAKKHWFLAPFLNKLSRIHIISWGKYFIKWKFK